MRTGSFVKICPARTIFKKLTIAFLWTLLQANTAIAADSLISQEETLQYLRWNLFTGRDQLQFSRVNNKIVIKTFNEALYQKIKAEFEKFPLNNKYVSKINFNDSVIGVNAVNAKAIELELVDPSIEMFSFYREKDKKYVVDFWVDENQTNKRDAVSTKIAAVEKKVDIKELDTKEEINKSLIKVPVQTVTDTKNDNKKIIQDKKLKSKIESDKDISKFLVNPHTENLKTINQISKEDQEAKNAFRDFRYGATFFWDYEPIIPAFKHVININSKVPENFYPIDNRDFNKSEKEAHLQLMINFYRQKKWGLMYKSMKLFDTKYGASSDWELKEFLKGNAILKENIEKPNEDLLKNALVIFTNIVEKSDNYEMKKSVYKYLISYYYNKGETLKVLQIAKSFYAGSRDSFDFEESIIPAEAMLNSLAKLGQIEQIKELVEEDTMKKAVPAQLLYSYQAFAYLKSNEFQKVIDLYEKLSTGIAGLVEPGLMFNAAESYFRKGEYRKAKELYEIFTKNYAYEFVASNAHLRIALASDLMDENNFKVMDLYKRAVDLSVDAQASYEARVRYVAYRSVRKKSIDDRDREFRIFLEQDKNAQKPDKNLEKLLYQVRLRTLIVDKKYKEALSYLTLIPLNSMSKIDARVFEGDAAEIVYGYIQEFYQKSQYAQVIKVWQLYKDKYIDKVAMDPYMNFLVGSSYVKLGLYKGFDEIYSSFTKLSNQPVKTFPLWVDRTESLQTEVMLKELSLVKDFELKNWTIVDQTLNDLEKVMPNYNKLNYYRGLRAFNKKDYKMSVKFFEEFLAKQEKKIIYDPMEIGEMMQAYTDSIYELGQTDKFLKVSEALLNDTTSFGMDNAYIQGIRERIAYLGIEISSGSEIGKSLMLFEKKINDFKKAYPTSNYQGRINYLLAQAMLKNEKFNQARELFTSLVNDSKVSEHIRELAKSELGLLNLKEKTL